ncbi:unnamed protein product [Caenorhabditis angaria]|uniref:LTD domain-containing protein n=1 Tax=Caenorhabditis angaria TaxID=860376 RepID=A0A9P1I367_9PELO|nr:unnamed protein product [Caenorhabditis angaria]
MKIYIIFLIFETYYISAFSGLHEAEVGKSTVIEFSREKIRGFSRIFENGTKQIYDLNGNYWKDENGNPVGNSGNYIFTPPGSLLIKKVTKSDAAHYNHIPWNLQDLTISPPGVQIDPGQTGIFLHVF